MKVRLENIPVQSQKINCIKLVRFISNKGLKDCKDFVESLGNVNGVTCELDACGREAITEGTWQYAAVPVPTIADIQKYILSCGFQSFVTVNEAVPAPVAKKGQNQHTKALAKEQEAHAATCQTLAEVSADRNRLERRCHELETSNLLASSHAAAQALRIEAWRKANQEQTDCLIHSSAILREALAELDAYKLRENTTGVTFKTTPEAIQVFANFKARDVADFHRVMTALDKLTR